MKIPQLPQFQVFQIGDRRENVCVRNFTESDEGPSYYVSMEDIQDVFPHARRFKLNGHPIPFLNDPNGNRFKPWRIAFYLDETLEIVIDTPSSQDPPQYSESLNSSSLSPTFNIPDTFANFQKYAENILTQRLEIHQHPTPRLFIILPLDLNKWNPQKIIENKFRLHFLCECEHNSIDVCKNIRDQIHIINDEGFEIRDHIKFYRRYGKYILILLIAHKIGIKVGDKYIPAIHPPEPIKSGVDYAISYLKELSISEPLLRHIGSIDDFELLKGEDIWRLGEFLHFDDRSENLDDLYRVATDSSHVKWVCRDHYQSTYKEVEQKASEDFIKSIGGSYDPHLGKVTIKPNSGEVAKRFFKSLTSTSHVYELDIKFNWDFTMADLEALKNALLISQISILQLDLCWHQLSTFSKQSSLELQYKMIVGLTEPGIMKVVKIILPNNLIVLSYLKPRQPSHCHMISYELIPHSMDFNNLLFFAGALKSDNVLSRLVLDYQAIGDAGAEVLSEALMTNTNLTTLSLGHISIGTTGIIAISEALKINSTLTTLELWENSIKMEGAVALSGALKVNKKLKTLNLSTNSINDAGAIALSEALVINTTLTTLNLGKNTLAGDGAIALAKALKRNTTLTDLCLYSNSVGWSGIAALWESLETNTTLRSLNLWDFLVCDTGAISLTKSLITNTTLTTLYLGGNSITKDGAFGLSKALMANNSSLKGLDLWGNQVGDEGAIILSDALSINTSLTALNLGSNLIGDKGAIALAKLLRTNFTLKILNLGKNSIRKEGATALEEALKRNMTLTTLHLYSNPIGNEK